MHLNWLTSWLQSMMSSLRLRERFMPLARRFALSRTATVMSIIAVGAALGALYLAWGPASQFRSVNPEIDGYVQPRSISKLVERTQKSTVTIYCEYGKNLYSQGSGWSMQLQANIGLSEAALLKMCQRTKTDIRKSTQWVDAYYESLKKKALDEKYGTSIKELVTSPDWPVRA